MPAYSGFGSLALDVLKKIYLLEEVNDSVV